MLLIEDTIEINDAPRIPGLRFRHYRGEADYPVIAGLINGCKAHDGVERWVDAQEVEHNYTHLVNCDPQRDIIFAEVDGEPVGYCRGWWMLELDKAWIGGIFGQVLPAWRARGIGSTLLTYIEDRLAETLQHLRGTGEVSPGLPGYYSVEASDTERQRKALLENRGYRGVRYGRLLVRPDFENIPVAALPAGLEVRPAQPEDYRKVWDCLQEAFRDHWGYVEPDEKDYQGWLTSSEFKPELWQLAWNGDQVVGTVLNFYFEAENAEYNRKRGYTETICVRRPWRRQGVARALLTRSLRMFRDMGFTEACLGVDTQNENQAFNLYEGVGFRTVRTDTVYRKPITIKEG